MKQLNAGRLVINEMRRAFLFLYQLLNSRDSLSRIGLNYLFRNIVFPDPHYAADLTCTRVNRAGIRILELRMNYACSSF